jgi:hypothetical protein
MRRTNNPYLTSGHASNASVTSIASTATICSTTPIRSQEASWRSDDPEKSIDSNDNDLSQALAEDIAALEPIEHDYHRQQPFWLFSMIWYVFQLSALLAQTSMNASTGLIRSGGLSLEQSTFLSFYMSHNILHPLLAPTLSHKHR